MWSAVVFSRRNLYWEMNDSIIKVNFSVLNGFSNLWTSWHGPLLLKLMYEPFIKVNCKQSIIIFCSTYFAQTRTLSFIHEIHPWICNEFSCLNIHQKLTFWDNLPLYTHGIYRVQNIIAGAYIRDTKHWHIL